MKEFEGVYRRLGASILTRRGQRGLTQCELARIVGLTRASIANIEAGRQRILLHDVYKFCGAFGITPQTFLTGVW
jgi:transcriptional regulator with XRE-family HTH domain